MGQETLLLTLAVVFSFLMAWRLGISDVANTIVTTANSSARRINVTQTIFIIALFELLGVLFLSGNVTHTISHSFYHYPLPAVSATAMVYAMLAVLLSAITWLIITSIFSWYYSTTQSVIAAIVVLGLVVFGKIIINWNVLSAVILGWLLSPILAGFIAFLIFRFFQRTIFNAANPIRVAYHLLPWSLVFLIAFIGWITLSTGVKHFDVHLTITIKLVILFILVVTGYLLCQILLKQKIRSVEKSNAVDGFDPVEKLFSVLMMFAACALAYAHGSNDAANAIGPLYAIYSLFHSAGHALASSFIPLWILLLAGVGLIFGLSMYAYRSVALIKAEIRQLTASRAFTAQIAAVLVIGVASGIGLPVSTTQILVGAILGVAMARGIGALNLRTARNIFSSWLITMPCCAGLALIYYYLLRAVLL